ncbi:MBL fold metallo-hydrolase [Chloroflexota bacterium]
MADVSQVADGIYRIDVGRVKDADSGNFLRYSLVYFIVSNGQTAIIDNSPAAVAPAVLEAISGLGYDPSRLSYIILTHIHLDHAGGVGMLARQFPRAKVIVHRQGAQHLIEPEKLIEGTRQAYGEKFEAEYGPILPVPEYQVQAVEDGDVIRLGGRELEIMYSPGHASHHICVYDAQTRGLFSGDSLGFLRMGNNAIIIVAGFDLDLALESIDRISIINPERIYAAHGTASREPGEFIQSVRATTRDYGDIILGAMREGKGKEEMAKRLAAYHKDHHSDTIGSSSRRFKSIIPWYLAHFKRKGAV